MQKADDKEEENKKEDSNLSSTPSSKKRHHDEITDLEAAKPDQAEGAEKAEAAVEETSPNSKRLKLDEASPEVGSNLMENINEAQKEEDKADAESAEVEAKANSEEVKVSTEKEAATSEPAAPQGSAPSVMKDIPLSKMQQDALSKGGDDAPGQDAPTNETPSLNPAASKARTESSNDIEALYLKEMTKTSDANDAQLGPTDT